MLEILHILTWNVLRCPSGPGSFYCTEDNMRDKTFKTYNEMIDLLISRGIDISTSSLKSYAKKRLQHEGYYNLINGYKNLFLLPKTHTSDEDKYKPGTTLNEIYALYNFDRKLRNIFLKNILIIETNIKSLVSYTFSEKHGHNNYLIYSNFDMAKRDSNKNITSLISEIQRQIANRYSDPSISHYLKSHGYIPLWVLNNILTLGTISKFYSLMKQQERQEVSKIFHVSDAELESFLFYLSKVRNFCAHGNRLYCFKSKSPIATVALHTTLNMVQNASGQYIQGKNDLFAVMIIFKLLLPKNVFHILVKNVNHELDILRQKLTVLSEKDILNAMGFSSDWKNKILQ